MFRDKTWVEEEKDGGAAKGAKREGQVLEGCT